YALFLSTQKCHRSRSNNYTCKHFYGKCLPVISPLCPHPFFSPYLGNVAPSKILQYSLNDVNSVGDYERKPVRITRFAVFECQPPNHAAESFRWHGGSKYCTYIRSFYGMQHLDICGLQRRPFPIISLIPFLGSVSHRVRWVVFGISIYTPTYYI